MIILSGCASGPVATAPSLATVWLDDQRTRARSGPANAVSGEESANAESSVETLASTISAVSDAESIEPESNDAPVPEGLPPGALELDQVIDSVLRAYPLLEAALLARDAAWGDHLSAHGAFDLKLKGASENGPVGFYETYRQSFGFEQPLYGGGAVFSGYRLGRGEFQPWYLERQTNLGGEFKTGMVIPLARNVNIDARRAQLWRTDLGRQWVEPMIQLQRIEFIRSASYAYWDWIAAGRRYEIARSLLQIAQDRHEAIRRKVETGDADPPVLQDNRRLIVSREAKVLDAQRKLRQSAVKLSLFLRDDSGRPLVPDIDNLAPFPPVKAPDPGAQESDIQQALANRPELAALRLETQQLEIDLAEARNDLLPDLQAVVSASQDVGVPTSPKKDKSQFEMEAGLFLDVPVQRRKARGKILAVEAKLGQISAKTRMTSDKIAADVQAVYAALQATYGQIERARESVELANQLAEIERRKFELGESDLLSVNLREQQAAEAQSIEVDALQDYFSAQADYRAVLARD